jgi:hypothetical protein
MEKFYRVIFTNACGSVLPPELLIIWRKHYSSTWSKDFNVQVVACDQANVCISFTYTLTNVFGYVHLSLEWETSNAGPWSFLFQISTKVPVDTQTACFPVSSANKMAGTYVGKYGIMVARNIMLSLPIINIPKAVATTVNSVVGGGSVTFTRKRCSSRRSCGQ